MTTHLVSRIKQCSSLHVALWLPCVASNSTRGGSIGPGRPRETQTKNQPGYYWFNRLSIRGGFPGEIEWRRYWLSVRIPGQIKRMLLVEDFFFSFTSRPIPLVLQLIKQIFLG